MNKTQCGTESEQEVLIIFGLIRKVALEITNKKERKYTEVEFVEPLKEVPP